MPDDRGIGRADGPPPAAEDEPYKACPFCTLRAPASSTVCPHCGGSFPPDEGRSMGSRLRNFEGRLEVLRDLYRRQGRVVKVAGPVLLALVVVVVVLLLGGSRVTIAVVPNPSLVVAFEKEKRGNAFVLQGTVRNIGEDVPDLSLRSIRLRAEFVYDDGRVLRKAVFPKTEFRGEGALLNGESGRFALDTPAAGLKEVRLEAAVVDLGGTRTLIPPGSVLPRHRR